MAALQGTPQKVLWSPQRAHHAGSPQAFQGSPNTLQGTPLAGARVVAVPPGPQTYTYRYPVQHESESDGDAELPTYGGPTPTYGGSTDASGVSPLEQACLPLFVLIMFSLLLIFWSAVVSIIAVLVYAAVKCAPYVVVVTTIFAFTLLCFNQVDIATDKVTDSQAQDSEGRASSSVNYRRGRILILVSWVATILAILMVLQPISDSLRVWGLVIITAVSYGLVTDQIGCHQCIEYFTVGHNPYHVRLLATENAVLNGLAWGPRATWQVGFFIGAVLAFVAQNPALSRPFEVQELAVPAACCAFVGLVASEITSWTELQRWPVSAGGKGAESQESSDDLHRRFDETIQPHPDVMGDACDLRKVPSERRAKYLAVGKRHRAAYSIMIGFGGLLVYAVWAVRWFHTVVAKFQGDADACGPNAFLSGCSTPWRYVWIFAAVCHVLVVPGMIALITLLIQSMNGAVAVPKNRKKAKAKTWNNDATRPQYPPNAGFEALIANGHDNKIHLGPAAPPVMVVSDLEPQASVAGYTGGLVPRPLLRRVAGAPGYNSLIHVGHGLANNVLPVLHNHYPQIPR